VTVVIPVVVIPVVDIRGLADTDAAVRRATAGDEPRYSPTTAGEHLLAKFRESMPAFDGA
jgi:hypothetical protein